MMEDLADNINVAIRVRPLIPREQSTGFESSWIVKDNTIAPIIGPKGKLGTPYTFDRIFDDKMTTYDIFEEICRPIVDSAVQGYHGTIFAYGQSSSGKTFTMSGSPMQQGIISLSINEIFEQVDASSDREFLIRVSYMEIYNEKVTDLLSSEEKAIRIQEDAEKNIQVTGITEELVSSSSDIYRIIKQGDARRHVAETKQNDRSSRSHCIIRMIIESRLKEDVGAVTVAHMNFVDLAGSEKAAENSGDRLREGCMINRSLFSLGHVISKLSDGVSHQHIGFRDSKLTRILQNALGGNSKTAIIATITPATVEESHGTLRFALRAKTIKNKAMVNEVLSDAALLKKYEKQIQQLQKQLSELGNRLVEKEDMQQIITQQEDMQRQKEELTNSLKQFVISGAANAKPSKKRRRETWCPGNKKAARSSSPFPTVDEIALPEEFATTFGSPVQSFENMNMKAVSFSPDPTTKELMSLQDKYENLLQEHKRLEDEYADIQVFHSMEQTCLESNITKLIEENDVLQKDMEGMKTALRERDEMSDELFQLEHKYKIQSARMLDYQKELDTLRSSADSQSDVQASSAALEEMKSSYEKQVNDLKNGCEKLMTEVADLKNINQELRYIHASAQQTYEGKIMNLEQAHCEQCKCLKMECEDLKAELETQILLNQQQTIQLQQNNSQGKETESSVTDENIKAMSEQTDSLKQSEADWKERCNSLEQEIIRLKEESGSLELTVSQQNEECEMLKEELKKTDEEKQQLVDDIINIDSNDERITELEQECRALTERLEDAENESEVKLFAAQEECNLLRMEIEKIEAEKLELVTQVSNAVCKQCQALQVDLEKHELKKPEQNKDITEIESNAVSMLSLKEHELEMSGMEKQELLEKLSLAADDSEGSVKQLEVYRKEIENLSEIKTNLSLEVTELQEEVCRLKELENRSLELTSEIESLKNSLEQKQCESDEYKIKADVLETENSKLISEISDLELINEKFQERFEAEDARIKERQTEEVETQVEVNVSQEVTELQQEVCRLKELENRSSELTSEIESLKNSLEQKQCENEEYKIKADILETDNSKLISEITDLKSVNVEFQERMKDRQTEVETPLEVNVSQEVTQLQQEVCRLKELENRSSELSSEIESLKNLLEQKQCESDEYKIKADVLETENSNLISEITDLKSVIAELQERFEAEDARTKERQTEEVETQVEVNMSQEVTELQQEVCRLKELENRSLELTSEIESLKNSLEQKQCESDEYKIKADVLETENSKLISEISDLELINEKFQERFETEDARVKERQTEEVETQVEVNVSQEVTELQQEVCRLKELENRSLELTSEIESLKNSLEQKQCESDEYKIKADVLETENSKLISEISDLELINEKFQERFETEDARMKERQTEEVETQVEVNVSHEVTELQQEVCRLKELENRSLELTSEIESLKNSLEQKQCESDEYKIKADVLETENSKLISEITDLKSVNVEFQERFEAEDARITERQTEVETPGEVNVSQEVTELQQVCRLKELENRSSELTSEIESLKNSLEQKQCESEEYKIKADVLESANSKLISEITDLELSNEKFQERSKELESSSLELASEIESLKNSLEQKQSESDEYKIKADILESANSKLISEIAELESVNEEFQERVKNLEADNITLAEQNKEITDIQMSMKNTICDLEMKSENVRDLQEEAEKHNMEKQRLQYKVEELKETLSRYFSPDSVQSEIQTQLERVTTRHAEEMDVKNARVEKLSEELQMAKSSYKCIQSQLEEVTVKHEQEMSAKERELHRLDDELTTAKSMTDMEISKYRETNKQEISVLKEHFECEISENKFELEKLLQENRALRSSEMNGLEKSKAELEAKIMQQEKEILQLRQDLKNEQEFRTSQELQRIATDKDSEIARRLKAAADEADMYNKRCSELERELEKSSTQISNLEEEISKIKQDDVRIKKKFFEVFSELQTLKKKDQESQGSKQSQERIEEDHIRNGEQEIQMVATDKDWNAASDEADMYKKRCSDLEGELQKSSTQVTNLEEEISKMNQTHIRFKKKFCEVYDELQILRQKDLESQGVKQSVESAEDCNQRNGEQDTHMVAKDSKAASDEADMYKKRCCDLEGELQKSSTRVTNLEEEISKMKQTHIRFKKKFCEVYDELQILRQKDLESQGVKQSVESAEDCSQRNSEQDIQMVATDKNWNAASDEADMYKKRYSDLEGELQKSSTRVTNLEEEISKMNQTHIRFKKKFCEVYDELQTLKQKNLESQGVESAEDCNQRAPHQDEDTVRKYEGELEALKSKFTKELFQKDMELQSAKNSLLQSEEHFSKRIQQYKDTIEMHEERIRQLKQEVRRLTMEGEQTIVEPVKGALQFDSASQGVCQSSTAGGSTDYFTNILLKGENDRLKKRLSKLEAEKNRYEKVIEELRRRMEHEREKNKKYKQQMENHESSKVPPGTVEPVKATRQRDDVSHSSCSSASGSVETFTVQPLKDNNSSALWGENFFDLMKTDTAELNKPSFNPDMDCQTQ